MPGATCPNCGTVFDGNAPRFCTKCGASVSSQNDNVRSILERAIEALRVCDVKAAVPQLERAERISPRCSDVWFLYALANIRDSQRYEMYIGIAENRENESLGLFGKGDIFRFEEGWDNEAGQVISKAKDMLRLRNRNAAAAFVNRAVMMCPECSDVWFLKAAISDDPKWRDIYVRAAEGKPASKGLFGRDDLSGYRTDTLSNVKFRWEQPNPKLHIGIQIPDVPRIVLDEGNGFEASAELPNGAVSGKAIMTDKDGCTVGAPFDFTVRVSPDSQFILVNQGLFKSRLTIRDNKL